MGELARRLPNAAELHQCLADTWPECLAALGVDETFLRGKHGPCPVCGGKDRFRLDNRRRQGNWICNHCGAGDGFKLLQVVHGWSFRDALAAVSEYLGYTAAAYPEPVARPVLRRDPERATLTARVRDMLGGVTSPELVPDVSTYLGSRGLWPLPTGCTLKAHVGLDYYRRLSEAGKAYESLGRFPAMVGRVQDLDGETITAHVTYLEHGRKLVRGEAPARKLLSAVAGRAGCAIRLMPVEGDTLGVGEGIETCLAASKLHDGMPVWSCLSTALLEKFIPPPGVHRVVIFADADYAGLRAAWVLRDELEGRCNVELRLPKREDFAADLEARS